MPAGRPFGTFKYDNLEDLEKGIDKYFDDQDDKGKPYTLEGLALALNISPKTLWNYGENPKYLPAISRARDRCINYAAERLYDKNGANGAKFYLTNNAERMGGNKYSDKQEFTVAAEDNIDPDALKLQLKDLVSSLSEDERKALQEN